MSEPRKTDEELATQSHPLAEVGWWDAYSLDDWLSVEEVKKDLDDQPVGILCRTVGWVIENTEKRIALAQTWQPNGSKHDYGALWIVPRGCIMYIRELNVKETEKVNRYPKGLGRMDGSKRSMGKETQDAPKRRSKTRNLKEQTVQERVLSGPSSANKGTV